MSFLTGEPEYLDPLKDETPEGWIVTGYPWYSVAIPEHDAFLKAYQAKYNDYPRLGSVVGYEMIKAAAAILAKADSTDTRQADRRRRGHQARLAVRRDHVPRDRSSIDARRLRRQDGGEGRQGRDGRCRPITTAPTICRARRKSKSCGRRTDRSAGEADLASRLTALQRQRRTMSFYLVQFLTGLASAARCFWSPRACRSSSASRGSSISPMARSTCSAPMWLHADRTPGGALGFWGSIVLAALLVVAAIGALVEMVLLRRIYDAPELFQLLATFGLTLWSRTSCCDLGARTICSAARAGPQGRDRLLRPERSRATICF